MSDSMMDDIQYGRAQQNVGPHGCVGDFDTGILQRPILGALPTAAYHHHGDPNKPCPGGPRCPLNLPDMQQTMMQRGAQYGDYSQMAYLAQRLKETMREGSSWDNMGEEKRESLEMIATKIARLVCGNPDIKDSWHDIAGYAKLAEDRCPTATP